MAANPRKLRIIKNASWLLSYRIANLVNSFFIGIWIARYLGPENYGIFSYAFSIAAISGPLRDFAIRDVAIRELKLHPEREGTLLGTAIGMRAIGAMAAAVLVFVLTSFSRIELEYLNVFCGLIVLAWMVGGMASIECHFLANERPKIFIICGLGKIAVSFFTKLTLILTEMPVQAFLIWGAIEVLVGAVMAYIAYTIDHRSVRTWRFSLAQAKLYCRYCAPLILAGLTAVVYMKIDIVMLGELVSTTEAGTYAVASRLSQIWYMVPGGIVAAVFPRLLELRRDHPAHYQRRLQDMLDFLAALAFSLAIFVSFFSDQIVVWLFGERYAPAGLMLSIHIWVGVFVFARSLLNAWIVSESLFGLSLKMNAIGAVMNVSINLVLIPIYGGVGAAFATLISYGLASTGVLFISRNGRSMSLMVIRSLAWPRRIPTFVANPPWR